MFTIRQSVIWQVHGDGGSSPAASVPCLFCYKEK